EAAGHAGDQAALFLQLLDELISRVDQVAHLHEAGPHAVLGNLEDGPFGLVEQDVGVLLGVVGAREHLGGRLDEPPQRGSLLDDARVVLDVGGTRHAVGQAADVGRPAHVVELARSRQLVLQRDQVDRQAPLRQADHLVEDPPVRVAEEVLGVDDLGRLVEGVVVDQDGAENALLGFEVVRQRAIHGGLKGYEATRLQGYEGRPGEATGKTTGAPGSSRTRPSGLQETGLPGYWASAAGATSAATTFTFTSAATS